MMLLKEFNLDTSKDIVLYVGRFEFEKQVDSLVESVPLILKKKSDVIFVFIGDGSLLNYLKTRAEVLDVMNDMRFLGFQSSLIVQSFMELASVIWIPMSGFLILEAAALGKPIAAFDIEWHSEFVINGKSGLLMKNRDCKEMANAVLKILSDPILGQKLGYASQKLLAARYNPEYVKDLVISFYKSIIQN